MSERSKQGQKTGWYLEHDPKTVPLYKAQEYHNRTDAQFDRGGLRDPNDPDASRTAQMNFRRANAEEVIRQKSSEPDSLSETSGCLGSLVLAYMRLHANHPEIVHPISEAINQSLNSI